MKKIKVAVIQHECSHKYKENIKISEKAIKKVAAKGAKLVLLPELNMNPYFCIDVNKSNYKLAESISGKTTKKLQDIAKENNIIIVATIFEKRAKGLYHNTAIVLDKDGSLAGFYRKMHLPEDPGFYEKYYFAPGDTGFKPIKTSIGKLGVLICWDQWFPESARIEALYGADILLFPSAIGWEKVEKQSEKNRQLDAWFTIQRSHAIANNLPVMASNRVGVEFSTKNKNIFTKFWGSSFIADHQGEIISKAGIDDNTIIVAEINLKQTEKIRKVWPYFRDRRIDYYETILNRYID